MNIELTHQELSLLVFALDGALPSPSNCEEVCPVADHLEEVFHASALPPDKRLSRHLNNHLREALIECGMFDLLERLGPEPQQPLSEADRDAIGRANQRLRQWRGAVRLEEDERQILRAALKRLGRGPWFAMPRTMWRLRKKLRAH